MKAKKTLGLILKTARQARGIRQRDLSPELGITPAALSHIEAGRNTASPEVIEVYARHFVASENVPRLVRALMSEDPRSISEVSELLNPADPKAFETFILESSATAEDPIRASPWELSVFNSPAQSRTSRSSRYAMVAGPVDDRHFIVEALRSFITKKGGRALIAGRDSSDFGMGFSLKCDLIETTKSLVIEVRPANRSESRSIPEIVGKTILLKENGFNFVLCFTSKPNSRLDEIAVQLARDHGAAVIWLDHVAFDDSDSFTFAGDPII